MNEQIWRALESDRTIDITTTGRVSGLPRRIEIWFHNVDGAIYITGTPGTRDWYANLLAEPSFTFHLKDSTQADLAATAGPVTDPDERRRLLHVITDRVSASQPVDNWVADSPLVHVEFEPDL
ncbi:MAG: nitroreductase/quinone reductase family protein [Acidimicrobiia bacterium]